MNKVVTLSKQNISIYRFFNKFGMPGVLGCIDCTHVAIVRPIENEERYYCRKQYHSLNVQLVIYLLNYINVVQTKKVYKAISILM